MENNNNVDTKKQNGIRVKKITITGILSAIVVLILFGESVTPTGRLGFYTLAGFVLAVVLIETGIKWAWASYAVTCLVGFLIVPEKLNILPYVLFFGIYTPLKYHIESLRRPWLEILLKFLAFNLFLWPAWSIAKTFLPASLTQGTWVILGGVLAQVAFAIYDILFTAWIRYYLHRIMPRIKKS